MPTKKNYFLLVVDFPESFLFGSFVFLSLLLSFFVLSVFLLEVETFSPDLSFFFDFSKV